MHHINTNCDVIFLHIFSTAIYASSKHKQHSPQFGVSLMFLGKYKFKMQFL